MALGKNTGVFIVSTSDQFDPDNPPIQISPNGNNYYLMGDFSSLQPGTNTFWWNNYPNVGNSNGSGSSGAPAESIPAVDALAVDKKIDDGSANGDGLTDANVIDFGSLMAGNFTAGTPTQQGTNVYNCTADNNQNVYNVTDVNAPFPANCVLLIKMMSTNGMNQ